jgi:hypothetical protein
LTLHGASSLLAVSVILSANSLPRYRNRKDGTVVTAGHVAREGAWPSPGFTHILVVVAGQISRNDPCPCGSGLKYKRCCMGKRPPVRGRRLLWVVLMSAVILSVTITIGVLYSLKSALGLGAALLLLAGIYLVTRGAPPSRGNRSGSSDINFGR